MTSRFVLCDEKQSVIWRSPSDIPEVDISISKEIDTFATYAEAFQAAGELLAEKSAKPTWADVRPIEGCAHCGTDFDTRQPHHALVISEETGDEMSPEVLDCWYVARFCPACGAFKELRHD